MIYSTLIQNDHRPKIKRGNPYYKGNTHINSKEDAITFSGIIIIVASIIVYGICLHSLYRSGYKNGKLDIQKEAIEKGYAIYNPTNSLWIWECDYIEKD